MPKTISYAAIDAKNRLRPVDMDHAAFLAASFEEKGVQEPIVVTPRGDGFKLAEGGHRHAAMGLLGWTQLEIGKHVRVEEMDEFTRKLREIDENLIRRELNALDRALFITERRRLYTERRQQHGGDRKSEKFKEEIKSQSLQLDLPARFTAEVAEKVGLSERTVQLALRIAEKLDPLAIKLLRGTKIERNQQALLALCEIDRARQCAAAQLINKGEAKTVAEARISIGLDREPSKDPQPRIYATLLEQWERANARTKAAFLEEIGAAYVKSDAKPMRAA